MDVKKMTMVITAMVLFSLATLPAPLAAMRFDVEKLLTDIEIPAGKSTGDSTWCDTYVCTRTYIPYCHCTDASFCTKCVCYLTVAEALKPYCEDLASKVGGTHTKWKARAKTPWGSELRAVPTVQQWKQRQGCPEEPAHQWFSVKHGEYWRG